ncbi:hypothetical protein [Microbacterium sp. 1.5R]|uniref:hypothetical protein n=1 Tax=Microbacterium sp. 1.5R TaxID=1916917 RepID=UPI0011A95AB8|nr:hypothetical protein [Microbacterium sp. 1.5R]
MNAQATRRGVPAAVLWGGLGALAWATITIITGGSSAHADEQGDAPLLEGVSSLVSQTVSTVAPAAAEVVAPVVTEVAAPVVTEVAAPVVTEVVAPVVTEVVAPVQQTVPVVIETVTETVAAVPVAGPATQHVVDTVTDTAEAVVAPVSDLLQNAPVSQIIRPVQDAVSTLPVVGSLIDDLGVDELVPEVVGVVDETTTIVGEVVENAVPPVIDTVAPRPGVATVVPDPAGVDGVPDMTDAAASVPVGSLAQPGRTHASAAGGSRAIAAPEPDAALPPISTTRAPASEEEPIPAPSPVGTPAAPVAPASAGSGGSLGLSHARLSDVGIPALLSVERTPGAPDDVLPTSLVADTDVSPD